MKEILNVRGSQINKPLKLEVNKDTVYLRTDIQKIEEEDFVGWQYDEIQYDLKEYIELIGNENEELNKSVVLLEEKNTNLSETNIILLESIMELTSTSAESEARSTSNEEAIVELSTIIMSGGM